MPSNEEESRRLIESLEDQIGFRELSPILKASDIDPGMGWKQLLEKLISAGSDISEKIAVVLTKVHQDLILAGDKECFVYSLTDEQVTEIKDTFEALEIPDSPYRAQFPFSLNENQLKQLDTGHVLTAKQINSDGDFSLIFCSSRTQVDRDNYSMSQVTEAVKNSFPGYDGFIAIRSHQYQVRDIITLRRAAKRLEILIDHPDRIREPETAEERCLMLLARLSTRSAYFQNLYENNVPENLFPCINSIYTSLTEGRVLKLSFRAPSKSLKKESVAAKDDLRKEPFHEAGLAAVGSITPFDITVQWDKLFPHTNGGALRIQSTVGAISNPNAFVSSASLLRTKDDLSVKLLVNKLVAHMTA